MKRSRSVVVHVCVLRMRVLQPSTSYPVLSAKRNRFLIGIDRLIRQ